MFKTLLSKNHQRRPAQALVEFTLVALVFLFMVVMIIEVARILQAYVTIQHAAREAARYAVTGQFDPKYGVDPTAGWDETRNTAEPLRSIRPCWPLFADDEYVKARPLTDLGLPDVRLYQPYRGPRTCSVEEAAIRNMAGLILNPNAKSFEPDYYEIIVGGSISDIHPTDGSFQRGNYPPPGTDTVLYSTEYNPAATDPYDPSHTYGDVVAGTSRGYAGDPGKKVQVQIQYRIRMITPLLSSITPSVMLNAYSVMTVETFGSTGLQREAVLPPPDPKPLPFTSDITPPDLVIAGMNCPVTGPLTPGSIVDCTVRVENQGSSATAADSALRLYRREAPQLNPLNVPLDVPDDPVLFPSTPDGTIPAGLAVGYFSGVDIPVSVSFPDAGSYYVYAWADAGATEDNIVPEFFAAAGPPYDDPLRLTNNLAVAGPFTVEASADLQLDKAVSKLDPALNEEITYTVTVTNAGPNNAPNVVVSEALDPALIYVSHKVNGVDNDPSYNPTTGVWNIGPLNVGTPATLEIVVRVNASSGTIANTASITSSGVTEADPGNETDSVTISPGSVDMTVTKTVSPTEVDFGTSPTVTYTVGVTNNSSSATTATTVEVKDTFNASQLTPTAASGTGWSCTVGSGLITCSRPSLPPGPAPAITITAVVNPAVVAGTIISNQAELRALQMPTPKVSAPALVTVRGADIEVTKETSAVSVNEGQQFTYTVMAHNRGPSDAQNISISDVLPSTLQYVSHAVNGVANDPSYVPATGLWTVGSVSKLTSKRLTITVFAKTGTYGTTIPNTAILQSGSTPPQPAGGGQPDTASVSVQVVGGSADLGLTKEILSFSGTVLPNGSIVQTGSTLSYRLTVSNAGPASVTGRSVQDATLLNAFSSGTLQYVSATASQGSFSQTTGQWTGISLTAGQTATVTITFRAIGTVGGNVVFTNTANIVPGIVPDLNGGNDSASATIQINWPDPIFINAGGNNCTEDEWGITDPTLGNRNFDWTVDGSTYNWSLTNGDERNLIQLNNYTFVDLAHAALSAPGQNLFGCRTETTGFLRSFTYRFDPIVPGRWRLYLAFAEWATDSQNYRLLTVRANGTGTEQVLPGMNDFDIVEAIADAGIDANRHSLGGGRYNVHYIILPFNLTVGTQGWLSVRFTRSGGWNDAHVNGLGIEYLGP